jgi:hypothetical protein
MQAYREYFELSFDNYFLLHLDGVIAVSLLDFYFKPELMLGMEDPYGNEASQSECHSFKEFIKHISSSNIE